MFQGDVYASKTASKLPTRLEEANRLFKRSALAKQAFGKAVVDHYAHHFDMEQQAYTHHV